MDWEQLNDVGNWDDLNKMMEEGAENDDDEAADDSGSFKRNPPAASKNKGGADKVDKPAPKPSSALVDVAVSGWADMKQFDDDHDPDWFEEEEKRLASIYGGQFIKVKYTEQGRPGYFCELCLSEMNAKKSLEAHCEGMKHLKKKALWEKNRPEQDDRGAGMQKSGWSDGNARNNRDRSPFGGHIDRSRSPPGKRGRGREFAGAPPRRFGAPRDQCVLPSGPSSMFEERGSLNRMGRPRHDSPPRGRYGLEHRLSPPPGRRSRSPPGRYNSRPQKYSGRDPYDDTPRERYGDPHGQFDETGRDHGAPAFPGHRDDHINRSVERTPITPEVGPSEKLSGGTTGLLLTKLASCFIKDEEDADLALSVVSALTSSLRVYNTKLGEKKITELLMEAELKLNTLKALKVGLKLLGNNQTPGSSTVAAFAAAAAAAAAATPRPSQTGYANPTPQPAASAGSLYPAGGQSHYSAPPNMYESGPPSGNIRIPFPGQSLANEGRGAGWPQVGNTPHQFTSQGTPYPPSYR